MGKPQPKPDWFIAAKKAMKVQHRIKVEQEFHRLTGLYRSYYTIRNYAKEEDAK
jgi:hypothetical protein